MFFRHPCDHDGEGATDDLLYVEQTAQQKRLMALYGNHMTMLDATYKVCKYDIPLYFVVVKTNSDYQVVGTFSMQSEKSSSIAEALEKLKEWNSQWQPSVWMVDNCAAEQKAIQNTFKGNVFCIYVLFWYFSKFYISESNPNCIG